MKNRSFRYFLTLILVKNVNVKYINDYCKKIHKKI